MSVKFLLSNALYRANEMLIETLREKRGGESRHIIIVPDRFTLSCERDILKSLKENGAFDLSVTSFKRLASYTLGKRAENCLTAEGAVMLISRVIDEVRGELKVYGKASSNPGFASELYAVITSIRNNGISVQELREALPKLPTFVREKSKDVLTVYERYLALLSTGYLDGSTLLSELVREIPESDYIAGSDFYVLDHFSFTAEQRRVLGALAERGKSLNIALVSGRGYPNERIYPEKEYGRLVDIFIKSGVKVEEKYVEAASSEEETKLSRELFAYCGESTLKGGENISIFECKNQDEEINHLARKINALIKSGYRYKDIAVLSGDVEGGLPVVKRIFARAGIPFFADEKKSLLSTPLAGFLVRSIRAGIKRTDREQALKLIKNPFSGIDSAAADSFQHYCVKYNINYNRLFAPLGFGKNDEGYSAACKAQAALPALICKVPKSAEMREFVHCVRDFLVSANTDALSDALAERQTQKNDLLAASTTTQSKNKLNIVLNELESLMGGVLLTDDGFLALLSSSLASVKISYIPVYSDSVYIGGASESRFSGYRALFIISALAGKLPEQNKCDGIFGDGETAAYANIGINLEPTSLEESIKEKLHILELLLMPKEKLFISYYSTDGAERSELVSELMRVFQNAVKETYEETYEETENDSKNCEKLTLLCQNKESAEYELACERDGLTREYLKAVTGVTPVPRKKHTTPKISCGKELFFPRGYTKISQLNSYFYCPYRHFIEYGLGVTKTETGSSASLAGSFIHRVLEIGVPRLKNAGFPDEGETLTKLTEKLIIEVMNEDSFASYKTEKYTTTFKKLCAEADRVIHEVSKRCRNSNYVPSTFEFSFGLKEDKRAYYVGRDDFKLLLRGKIDRVDETNGKAVLVDYKTGSVPDGATDVYFGTGVQLYVYMSALEKAREVKSVGALYYPVPSDFKTDELNTRARMSGFLLAPELLNYDRETDLYSGSSSTVRADFKKGKPNTATAELLCNEAELSTVKKYASLVCDGAVRELVGGFISPSPLDKTCSYCNYSLICKGKEVKQRNTTTVKKGALAEALAHCGEEVTREDVNNG